MKKPWVISYPLSTQQRLWSDWADAQADLSLHWAYMPLCWFYHEAAHMCLVRRKPVFWVFDWPAQPQKLARGFKFKKLKLAILYYLGSEQQRCWSDCADAQADLRLYCWHRAKHVFSWCGSYLSNEVSSSLEYLSRTTGFEPITLWPICGSTNSSSQSNKRHWNNTFILHLSMFFHKGGGGEGVFPQRREEDGGHTLGIRQPKQSLPSGIWQMTLAKAQDLRCIS